MTPIDTRALLMLLALSTSSRAQHCETLIASVNDAGTQGTSALSGPYGLTEISANGRYVAFWTSASGLVPGTTTGMFDQACYLVLRDTWAGRTERVDLDSAGVVGNAWGDTGDRVSLSADGRFVAFDSESTNLVPGDTNGSGSAVLGRDVFVRDRLSGTTTRVSVATGGAEANDRSMNPSLSADGRYVAFESLATNLVAGDSNGASDVFVHDRLTGTTARMSVEGNGAEGLSGFGSFRPCISADGRWVSFLSDADFGTPHGIYFVQDVYCKDRQTGAIELVSISTSGEPQDTFATEARISGDGRYVAFLSFGANLVVEGGTLRQVYRRDRIAQQTVRVSVQAGNPNIGANAFCNTPSISDDGRFVAFTTTATNLVAGDFGVQSDVFVRDMDLQVTGEVSRPVTGEPAVLSSFESDISADGRAVAFASLAGNIVPGDSTFGYDVYVFRRDCLPPSAVAYCFGNATACPCGNAGLPGNGCASSIHPEGANLFATGLASISTDTLVLHGSGMSDANATYFQGTDRVAGGLGMVFGDGLRCAGGSTLRLGSIPSPGGASRYPRPGDESISARGLVPAGGGVTRGYQCRYRNAAAFCTPAAFNLTNAVEAVWIP